MNDRNQKFETNYGEIPPSAYCALSTVCRVTVKRPLVADFEVVASLCNVDKIYI